MINKDELIKSVAESSGISNVIAHYFFEVFINRLSGKLKFGEAIQFHKVGYFHKRRCRIPSDKNDASSVDTTHLHPLIIFSESQEIFNDEKSYFYFSIPDLKTLWQNDAEFDASLKEGEFSPIGSRSQLINSFATKADVILSTLRMSERIYEEEFLLHAPMISKSSEPFTPKLFYDLSSNSGQSKNPETISTKPSSDKNISDPGQLTVKEGESSTLPWNMGRKFYDKKVEQPSPEDFKAVGKSGLSSEVGKISKTQSHPEDNSEKKIDAEEALDEAIVGSDIHADLASFREFQPVRSRLASSEINKVSSDEQSKLRQNKKPDDTSKSQTVKLNQKFTEVKSKTEVYHLRGDIEKLKKKNRIVDEKFKKSSDAGDNYKVYRENRNLLPIVIIASLIIIGAAVIYFYLIKTDKVEGTTVRTVQFVNPAPGVNLIERDYEFAVTYPYHKTDGEIPVEGVSQNVFLVEQPVKQKQEPVKQPEVVEKPVEEIKIEKPPVKEPEQSPKVEPQITEQKSSRIFIYNNYYVVYVRSFSTYSAAEREAEKYFDEGYNAFVEVVEAPGKPTLYQLNVGDFTSEEFARQFQEKYIK